MKKILLALLFAGSAFGQETNLTIPATIGPLQVKADTESLLGTTSWPQTGLPAAHALVLEVPKVGGSEKLYITPYAHGLGIEYAGLLEFWTTKFSIHNNFRYDAIPKAPELWVGNPLDTGGFMAQGNQDFTVVGGSPVVSSQWVELVSQTFLQQSHGDIRYIVRGNADKHEFRGGAKGSESTYASIGPNGLVVGNQNVMELISGLGVLAAKLQSRIGFLECRLETINNPNANCPPPLE